MPTGSNFDRPPPGIRATEELFYVDESGFQPSLQNIYNAGIEVVKKVIENWEPVYRWGVDADNYVGDVLESLAGGVEPDIGSAWHQEG